MKASKIQEAKQLLISEMKTYADLGFSEISIARLMETRLNHHWSGLLKFSKGNLKSLKVAIAITNKILKETK
mgnify:CR=1 FL=1